MSGECLSSPVAHTHTHTRTISSRWLAGPWLILVLALKPLVVAAAAAAAAHVDTVVSVSYKFDDD